MVENQGHYEFEDVIDLRELIRTLWHWKWLIIGVSVLAGLAAYLVSNFLLPPQYQAKAYLTLLETSIRSNEIQLELDGLADLVEAEAVKQLVFEDLGITDWEQQEAYDFSASMRGGDQLHLQVTVREPALAAETANAWADVVVDTLNELFGRGEQSGEVLELGVRRAKENWSAAQQALEDYYPENQVEALGVQLAAAKSRLALYQAKVDQTRLLLTDLAMLRRQLEDIPGESQISASRYLALVALQQRAVSASQDQLTSDGVSSESGKLVLEIPEAGFAPISAGSALAELQVLGTALEIVESEVLSLARETAAEVNQLRADLEIEEYQLAELTGERDLARQTYTALRSQLEENRISRTQQESVVQIGAEAVEPRIPSGPHSILITALAGLTAGGLAILSVMIREWWFSTDSDGIN